MRTVLKKTARRALSIILSLSIILTGMLTVFPQAAYAASSDAVLSSQVYSIDNTANTITKVPYSDNTVEAFIANLSIPAGATYKIIKEVENDQKAELTAGDIVTGNEIVVTAEDSTTKKTYTIYIDEQYSSEFGFSHIQGYNNWFYKEYTDDGNSRMMEWGKTGRWSAWEGMAEFCIIWRNMAHPDTNSHPARVFKVPRNGKMAIDWYVRKMNEQSNGVGIKILKNEETIWPSSGDWQKILDTQEQKFHMDEVQVSKGDEIVFLLDNNGNSAADTTYWRSVLTYMPEEKFITSIDIKGDLAVQVPASGSTVSKYLAVVMDQNEEAIPGEMVNWSIQPAVDGVSVGQDGTVTVQSGTAAKGFNLVAASVTKPGITALKPVLLTDGSKKISNDDTEKLLVLNSNNVSMLVDYNNKAKIISLKVNGVETLDSEGIVTSIEAERGSPQIGSASLSSSPELTITENTAVMSSVYYSNDKLSVDEIWIFNVGDEKINWDIKRSFKTPNEENISIEQRAAAFTFKKDIFDTAFRSDGGSQVLLSPGNRETILAFDPADKQYGTTEAGMAYEGGGLDLINVPNGFILSLECTSDRNVVSEFYRDPYNLALKFENKLNSQPFTHNLYRPEFDLGFHCFIPAYGGHSYDPVVVGNAQFDEQSYEIKAYTNLDKYYDIGILPEAAGIDEYKFGRFLSEFGRTSIIDLDGIGGSWNALRLEFADSMAGQYAVNIANGMQYTDKNSKTVKILKALVEAGIRTQKENGHMVGCPDIAGQASNYETGSEADAAIPMDAAAYINATRDVEWANSVKEPIRRALDYRLSRDANDNGLVESELDNNYGSASRAWLDVLYVGGEDAYLNALMYSALTEWAYIEENVIGDAKKAQYYYSKAQKLKETYNKDLQDGGLWSDSYQGFIGWRQLDGSVKADVKYLHVNAAAIAYGVATRERAQEFLFGAFDGYSDIEDWMVKNNVKTYPLNLQTLDRTEIMERFLNEWPGWQNGQVFPQTTGDMMAAYAKLGSTAGIKYMKNLIDLYFTEGDLMYREDTFDWDLGSKSYNCNTRMAINIYSAATLITDIFGFKPKFWGLEVNPVLDETLYGSEIDYNMRGHYYRVRFDNDATRTLLANDGEEKVVFKWNSLVPGQEYTFKAEDLSEVTQSSITATADEDGIAQYEINKPGQYRITISGPAFVPEENTKVYKATAGYSDTQGANNWSYYELNGSENVPMQWNQTDRQWENEDKSSVVTCRLMQSGSSKQAVREFKVPESGVVEITGSIRLRDYTDSTSKVKVLKNGNPWWPASESYVIDSNLGIGFKGIMNVAKDDVIQFVAEGAEPVVWAPKIAYIGGYTGEDSFEVLDMPSYSPLKTEYNAAKSFANVQGIDNWYYEEYVNGISRPMHWNNDFNAWQGSATFALIAADWMHPEMGVNPVRTFEVPQSGKIEITGAVQRKNATGDGMNVRIEKNGEVIWPQDKDWLLLENTEPVEPNVVIDVESGDRIGFVVNCNNDTVNDTTGWAPNIKYIEVYKSTFDACADFKNVQGSDNWYYREIVGDEVKDMTWNAGWNAWQGSAQFALIWDKVMHPDFGHQSARVFKTPRAGRVKITGAISKGDPNGNGSNVQIRRNNEKIWPTDKEWQLITGPEPVETNIELNVAAGDEIAFVVDSNGENTANDAVDWIPVISYIGREETDKKALAAEIAKAGQLSEAEYTNDSNMICPKGTATRAETAVVVFKLLGM